MKKISFVLICALAVMLFTGCTSVSSGGIGNGEMGGKVGEASIRSIFSFPFYGDGGIMAAARNANITTVTGFDVKVFALFNYYTEKTTIVTGN